MASKFKLMIGLLLLGAQTCKKEGLNGIPLCIVQKIEAIKADNVWNPPGSVWRYDYNGKKVYYIASRCCDIPSILYDEQCNVICSPDGGFTGKGDGKCQDFFQKRKNEKLIWKDDRK